MFTGLITALGTVITREDSDADVTLTLASTYDAADIELGESIACSGACLTVTDYRATREGCEFTVTLSNETLMCTAPHLWEIGSTLNLERALKLGDRLGGHLVSGHVDGTAILNDIKEIGDCYILTLTAPKALSRFIAAKGSVTLDGISLTVNEAEGERFTVNIIPHTWEHTTLKERAVGDKLNLEVDQMARYAARLLEEKP